MSTITKAEITKATKLMMLYWPTLALSSDAVDAWCFAISARQLTAQQLGAAIDRLLATHTGGYPPTLPQLLDAAAVGTRRDGAKHFKASTEAVAGIFAHNEARGFVPVFREAGGRTSFSFYPRADCRPSGVVRFRGVEVMGYSV